MYEGISALGLKRSHPVKNNKIKLAKIIPNDLPKYIRS
jgi:hypothetical protein